MIDSDLLTRSAAREVLAPYYSRLADCLLSGWAAWEAVQATDVGRRLGKTARARIVWDHATARAAALFEGDPNVTLGQRHGLLILDFGSVMVRFKKLDAQYRTRGIPTGQQQMFDAQDHIRPEQLTLWPTGPMVVAGYLLDELETAIERLVLVLSRRGIVIWTIDIPTEGITPVRVPPLTPPQPATVRSVRQREETREVR